MLTTNCMFIFISLISFLYYNLTESVYFLYVQKWLREILQLTPPSQESSAEELKYQAFLEETTYDPKHDKET